MGSPMHFQCEYSYTDWVTAPLNNVQYRKWPALDNPYFVSKLVNFIISILFTRKSSWQDEIINVQEIIPGWKCNFRYGAFWTEILLNGSIYLNYVTYISLNSTKLEQKPIEIQGKMSTSRETQLTTLSLQSQTHYTKLTTLIEDWKTDYRLVGPILHSWISIDLIES